MYSTIIIRSKATTNSSGSCFINIPVANKKFIISLKKPLQLGMSCFINCNTSILSTVESMLREEYSDTSIVIISQI